MVGEVEDAQRDAADADAAKGARAEPQESCGGVPGAGIVADVVELDVEARDGLPAAAPWPRQHGRADHVARGQAGEDPVEEMRREVAQQVDRTLRRRRRLRFATGKHGWLVARVWWLECFCSADWGNGGSGRPDHWISPARSAE